LRGTDLLRFQPDGENGSTASDNTLQFRAWDTTIGTAGTTADTTTNGDTSAFSAASASATIDVTPINDAPVLISSGDTAFDPITENDINNSGMAVADLLANSNNQVSDVDNTLLGLALTASTASNGTWEYSTDGGTSWTTVSNLSDSAALLLDGTDLLRFQPDGENGSTASENTLQFRAWDKTTGTAGSTADTTTNGDTSAFSAVSTSASIAVTTLNDAPVLVSSGDTAFDSITEDNIYSNGMVVSALLNNSNNQVSDVDNTALGIALTTSTASNGSWEYSTDGGSQWTTVANINDSAALLLNSSDLIRFKPDGENGSTASDNTLSFRAWDKTSGSAGSTADTTTNGNTSAFSAVSASASIAVTATNDAPLLLSTGDAVFDNITENDVNNNGMTVTALLASGGNNQITDSDDNSVIGIALTAGTSTNGSWEYSTDGGTVWTTGVPCVGHNCRHRWGNCGYHHEWWHQCI